MSEQPAPRSSAEPFDPTGTFKPAAVEPASRPGVGQGPPTVRSGAGKNGGERGSTAHRRGKLEGLPGQGDRLGSFVLEEPIGVGGMGAVFRALDLRLERHVALKLLPPEQSNDSDVVQRFYQEARAAARLDHENIARVYNIEHDNGFHYIAFEYIEGTTVRLRVAEAGPLPIGEAINYTLQIAGALVHAAERGVVHRDIKPSNIIVTPQGRAKLVDMGLARRFERGAGADDGLTQSGMTLGTFDYISPEQARDPRDVDVRSDLYSLGCTLFHMLTGRPPFPEGTVLQKLLQHQEEPPPDARSLNPAVPADLASILTKLMAKDRDRRYQTPEQLVRDLLTLAGTLGLRSISPEGLIWMSAAPAASWERHLIWGLPTLVLGLIVAVLVWMGQPPERTDRPPLMAAAGKRGPELTKFPTGPSPKAVEPRPAPTAPVPVAPRPAPREYTVRTGEELAVVLAKAPSGSTLILNDDGPYRLPMQEIDRESDLEPGPPRDLTIRAAAGKRPVVRPAKPGPENGEAALLALAGGHVVLEGLTFQLDRGDDSGTDEVALLAEGTDLTIRRCLFRAEDASDGLDRGTAVRIRPPTGPEALATRPAPVIIQDCHFGPGLVALHVQGRVELQVLDGTFGPASPIFWLDNAGTSTAVPARLELHHVSVVAGGGPVFQLSGAAAVVRLDDSVIAPLPDATATLVQTDLPDRLEWLGRGNLYGRIDPFLLADGGPPTTTPIHRFTDWREDASHLREVDSTGTMNPVWATAQLSAALRQADPTPAFRVASGGRFLGERGVRRGPFGPLPPSPETAVASSRPGPEPSVPPRAPAATATVLVANEPGAEAPRPIDQVLPPMTRAPEEAIPGTPVAQEREPSPAVAATPGPPAIETTPTETAKATPPSVPEPAPAPAPAPPTQPAALRTTAELRAALDKTGPGSEPIQLAAGAEFDLASCKLRGEGRWVLTGPEDPRAARPRIRLHLGRDEGASAPVLGALFQLDAGSVEIRNVDFLLDGAETASDARWTLFALAAGADLDLTRCTLTLTGPAPRSTLFQVNPAELGPGTGLRENPVDVSTVWMSDCLLRCASDVIDVAPEGRLTLELNNTIVASGGALVHGHGQPRRDQPEPLTLKLTLRQVAARAEGGLVQLESAPATPVLPQVEVVTRDSILATKAQGAPLFRVDGQENLDELRDRIRWDGHGVAYHQIEEYRRDQTSQPGTVPLRFDRKDWNVVVGQREGSSFHGEVQFVTPWTARRPIWSMLPDDWRLDPESPAHASCPELDRIPLPSPVVAGPSEEASPRD